MPDIMIRGISLPEGELKYVTLWVYGDGRVYVSNNASAASSRKLQDLAVPLPEGHGRLGDLDALQEEFKKFHDGKRLMLIDTAPTIIEADLEWKMKNCCCFSNTDQAEGGTDDDGNA